MKKTIELSIYTLLISSSIFSLILSLLTNYVVDNKFYIGLVCVLASFAIRLKSVQLSNYILGVLLVLGTLNLIKFSHIDFGFSITIWGIDSFGFNLIILIILLLFLSVNKKIINILYGNMQELTEEEKKENDEQRIISFMKKHEHKSIDDLQEVVDNPEKYVEHWVIASKRLIDKKKNVL